MLLKNCLVFLIMFAFEDTFSDAVQHETTVNNVNNKFKRPRPFRSSSDQIISSTYILTNPALYSLARLPIRLNDEPKISGSENVEQVHEKVLRPPLAFSYNKRHNKQDLISSASDNEDDKAEHKKEGKYKHGAGKSHHSDNYHENSEKSNKGYKGSHEHEKKEKGHHDKEGHKGSYSDEGGKTQKKFNDHGYEGKKHKEEKGEKKSEFEESGKHEKGHSTKGGHSVNKKDHFEKKHEFFDEYYEGGDQDKYGGYHSEKDYKKGGNQKGGKSHSAHHDSKYGKAGKSEKAKHYDEDKGHKIEEGHDDHHEHIEKYGKSDSHKGGKTWGYKNGDDGKHSNNEAHGTEERGNYKDPNEHNNHGYEKEALASVPDNIAINRRTYIEVDGPVPIAVHAPVAVPVPAPVSINAPGPVTFDIPAPVTIPRDDIKIIEVQDEDVASSNIQLNSPELIHIIVQKPYNKENKSEPEIYTEKPVKKSHFIYNNFQFDNKGKEILIPQDTKQTLPLYNLPIKPKPRNRSCEH